MNTAIKIGIIAIALILIAFLWLRKSKTVTDVVEYTETGKPVFDLGEKPLFQVA